MKKLNKLALGMKANKQREVCLKELIKVKPQKFKKMVDIKGKSEHEVEVEIVSVEQETRNGNDLLKVMARVWEDGKEIPIGGSLYYMNPPIMVPDGTFETVIDEFGKEMQVANFKEDPEEALRQIILETLRVTVLRE